MEISGMPTPEICVLPGKLRRTVLPRERNGDFTQCRCIGHTTFQLRGGHYHWAIAAPAKSSSPMP